MRKMLAISVLAFSLLFIMEGCSSRLVDFTIISSKSLAIRYQDGAKGQRIKGSSMGFLGLGANVKAAVDNAIEKAGGNYDALVDGVLYSRDNLIMAGYEVEGTPVNTAKLMALLGEDGFEKYCMAHKIEYHTQEQ